ncbi:hypothetical protein EV356DRAFT_511108 [Viridothelium virens]|uniref:Uncharacterized protein n=1 Tax=Viridothelium virens TaxID=1048519 RepID=A0A6A6GUL7_VIRVR|nr:hypothetical protein EV356DRAFT_511108 [Viridothelium virens]
MSKRAGHPVRKTCRRIILPHKRTTPWQPVTKRVANDKDNTITADDLCMTCSAIAVDNSDNGHSAVQGGSHHETFADIEFAAQAACHTCVAVLDKLTLDGHGNASHIKLDGPATTYAISSDNVLERLNYTIHVRSNAALILVIFLMILLDLDHSIKPSERQSLRKRFYKIQYWWSKQYFSCICIDPSTKLHGNM